MRVVHVVSHLDKGGAERVVESLIAGSTQRSIDAKALCLSYGGTIADRLSGEHPVEVLPPMSKWSNVRPASLTHAIQRWTPDVVHIHAGVWLKAARAAKAAGVPLVVYTEHGREFPEPYARVIADSVASHSTDVIVAVSEDCRTRIEGLRIPAHVLRYTISNGIDLDRFSESCRPSRSLRDRLGIPGSACVVGSLGRFVKVKAYERLIRSIAVCVQRGLDIHLILAGDGPTEPALKALARQEGLADRVHFLGWVDDTRPVLESIDLFALTSQSEGTSIALLEAMASRVCPLVTDVGGNAEVLGTALAELLSPSWDLKAFVDLLQWLATDMSARDRFGLAARGRVAEAYSLDGMVDSYAALYRENLATRAYDVV